MGQIGPWIRSSEVTSGRSFLSLTTCFACKQFSHASNDIAFSSSMSLIGRKSLFVIRFTYRCSIRTMVSASPFNTHSRLSDEKPAFTYGTAWKKDQTKLLVKEALKQGFRRVDTAAQPKHYQEHLVGEALREAYSEGTVSREDVYMQTKYTTPGGQDLNNMPYDPNAPLDDQLRTSVASSLKNLRPTQDTQEGSYLDCLLLHSPLPTIDQTLQAWQLLETYVPHQIKALGISNVTLPVLREIYNA